MDRIHLVYHTRSTGNVENYILVLLIAGHVENYILVLLIAGLKGREK